ncbi:MAG: SPFH domain-containing protein [Lachnospiraceae bacterium]|nr:SPFH domain-containing protein [Lachnospiraceae bacterium]
MAKFVIECPHCGRYAEASTGGFLGIGKTRTIDCSCGYTINVATDKMGSKICPHCGNVVIYDQSKGKDARCPVCHEKINTRESMAALVEFSCPSCNCKLSADKNAATYTCPLCNTKIQVQEQIAKENVKNQGLASVIKYEGDNTTFVWKHPIEDFNLGSQLIVHESQEAIFFKDGRALDLFGAGRYTLATQNLPILEELYKLPTNTDEVFHSEIYFINMTTQMGIKWGTDSKVRLFDPASGLHIELGACGNFSLHVNNSRKLVIKLVGATAELKQQDINGSTGIGTTAVTGKFKALIINKVKSNLARAIRENEINVLEIDEHIDTLSEQLKDVINETLDDYGLEMPEFYITSIMTPDDDPNFRRLKQQYADKTLRVREEKIREAEAKAAQSRKILEAQTEAQLKLVGAQGEAEALKLKAQAEAEAYKAQAFAEAEEMRAKGYTYQQETARKVGLEAMKNGITGGEGGSALGDIAGLGISLGAMGGVIGMTKEAMTPILSETEKMGSGVMNSMTAEDTWDCPVCGTQKIRSKFCPECGNAKPKPADTWDCPVCGFKAITSKFCPECGQKKPEPPTVWNCPACGHKGITSKFCPECGAKKPEIPLTWDCPECGCKGITSKFCPECGHKKEG